jgi:transposase
MRHELADCEWAAIEPMPPDKPGGTTSCPVGQIASLCAFPVKYF